MHKKITLEHIVDFTIGPALVGILLVIIAELFFKEIAHALEIEIIVFDIFVIILFGADLIFKFRRMKKQDRKKTFLKKYWIDILAIIPFFYIFRVFDTVIFFISESVEMIQFALEQGTELERDASRWSRASKRTGRFARSVRAVFRTPRFLKSIHFFEKPHHVVKV
jgi:uncharacterized membrane protein YhaH (DUF805 family)